MAQQAPHIIDLRRSYIPMDPDAYPPTMHGTGVEDEPESRVPVIPYDGKNFMPTPQGYSSFFGINSVLDVDALGGNVDEIFVIQTLTFQNIAVALKDDGIWTKSLSSSGAWTHATALGVPTPGTHKNWSLCIIDQNVYVYRQAELSYWVANPANSYIFTPVFPTFLNMAGQLGIFKAGGRLGFWDSENSISWSSLVDHSDLTPSLETYAGNTIFQDIVGRIVNVLQHGNGFIIYCTRSIVLVERTSESAMLFRGRAIFNNNGISYRNQAAIGDPDTTHYVMSTSGFCEITNGQSQFASPEASTYFKSSNTPIALKFINGRYLFFQFIDSKFSVGRVDFSEVTPAEPEIYYFGEGVAVIEDVANNESAAIVSAQGAHESIYLNETNGYTTYAEASATAAAPIFEDHLITSISTAVLSPYYAQYLLDQGKNYIISLGFSTLMQRPKITGGNENFIPILRPDLDFLFSNSDFVQDNANDFYKKQDILWWVEDKFYRDFLLAMTESTHGPYEVSLDGFYDHTPSSTPVVVETLFPASFVDVSFDSQANVYYGKALKSLWLQRSLVKKHTPKVTDTITSTPDTIELPLGWKYNGRTVSGPIADPTTMPEFASLAEFLVNVEADMVAAFNAAAVTGHTDWIALLKPDYLVTGFDGTPLVRGHQVTMSWPDADPFEPGVETFYFQPFHPVHGIGNIPQAQLTDTVAPFPEIRYITGNKTQTFEVEMVEGDNPTCTYKQLGYTRIKGHKHYTDESTSVVDDSTPEAADYTDICITDPPPLARDFHFIANGVETAITDPFADGNLYGDNGPVVVNGTSYSSTPGEPPSVPIYTVEIPTGPVLLQEGSIEPIYPTYLGAFVFDLHYKKWGKMVQNHKNLFDIFPVNTMAGEGVFPYETFLPKMACRLEDGTLPIFDQYPQESELCFGKIGFFRRGFTSIEEIRYQHRVVMTGTLRLEGAREDGRSVHPDLVFERPYENLAEVREGFSVSCPWFNVVFKGFFDLIALEARGYRAGKR